jgi:chromate reductase, NAD(P)H dehydrogenase (quinone)
VPGPVEIPLYNYDVERQGDPASVQRFNQALASADGVLIATPEYQRAVPGVLKNDRAPRYR